LAKVLNIPISSNASNVYSIIQKENSCGKFDTSCVKKQAILTRTLVINGQVISHVDVVVEGRRVDEIRPDSLTNGKFFITR